MKDGFTIVLMDTKSKEFNRSCLGRMICFIP
jgi:hypothetical protein